MKFFAGCWITALFLGTSLFSQNWTPSQNKQVQQIRDFYNTQHTSTIPSSVQTESLFQFHLPGEPAHLNPISNSSDPYTQLLQTLINDTLLVWEGSQYVPSLCQSYVLEDLVVLRGDSTGTSFWADKVFAETTLFQNVYQLVPLSKGNPLYRTRQVRQDAVQDIFRQCVATFYLKENVFWHDGTPFTAQDVQFSFQRLKNKNVTSDALRSAYQDLTQCEVVNKYQVRFVFEKENFQALDLLARFPLVPKHIYFNPKLTEEEQGKEFCKNSSQNRYFIGLGPYQIKTWKPMESLLLERFPKYHQAPRSGFFEQILVRFISDATQAYQAFQNRELDFLFQVNPEHYFLTPTDPTEIRGTYLLEGFTGIGWNPSHPAFQDQRVRQAMAYLFPKQDFIETHLFSYAQTIESPGFLPETAIRKTQFDPERAQELLWAAGWRDRDQDGILDFKGIRFEFELLYPEGDFVAAQVSQTFSTLLKKYGILLRGKSLVWTRFQSRIRLREFDSFFQRPSFSLDPLGAWHSREASVDVVGQNYVRFRHPIADELIVKLRKELDPSKRVSFIQQLEHLIFEEQPYLFLWVAPQHFIYRSYLQGVSFEPSFPGWRLQQWFIHKSDPPHQK